LDCPAETNKQIFLKDLHLDLSHFSIPVDVLPFYTHTTIELIHNNEENIKKNIKIKINQEIYENFRQQKL